MISSEGMRRWMEGMRGEEIRWGRGRDKVGGKEKNKEGWGKETRGCR